VKLKELLLEQRAAHQLTISSWSSADRSQEHWSVSCSCEWEARRAIPMIRAVEYGAAETIQLWIAKESAEHVIAFVGELEVGVCLST
jgi:hypothetical protein